MYKIGMYGGSFNPLHLGHVNDIIEAANQCEKLYVVLSNTNDPNEIDHRERLMWLKSITSDMENVEVFEIFDRNTSKDTYDWNLGAEDIKNHIGKKIDAVFSGDDYKGRDIWETLYPESEIVYFPRDEINISSTMIRTNPFEYYDYLVSFFLLPTSIVTAIHITSTTVTIKPPSGPKAPPFINALSVEANWKIVGMPSIPDTLRPNNEPFTKFQIV